MKVRIYFDGASRGNPGVAGAGAVIVDEKGKVLVEIKKYLGTKTNNQAEYIALNLALQALHNVQGVSHVEVLGDSNLVIQQLKGAYKVKSPNIIPLYNEVIGEIKKLKTRGIVFKYTHIRRNLNSHADRLANESIDEQS